MCPLRPNKSLGLEAARGKKEGEARQGKTRQEDLKKNQRTRQQQHKARQVHLVFLFSMHCILRFVSLIRDERQTRQDKTRQHDTKRQNTTQHKIKNKTATQGNCKTRLSRDKTVTRQDQEDFDTWPPKLKTPQTNLPDNPVLHEFKEEQHYSLMGFLFVSVICRVFSCVALCCVVLCCVVLCCVYKTQDAMQDMTLMYLCCPHTKMRQYNTIQCNTTQDTTRHEKKRKTGQDKTGKERTRQQKTRQDNASQHETTQHQTTHKTRQDTKRKTGQHQTKKHNTIKDTIPDRQRAVLLWSSGVTFDMTPISLDRLLTLLQPQRKCQV